MDVKVLISDPRAQLTALGFGLLFLIYIVDIITTSLRAVHYAKKVAKSRRPKLIVLSKHYSILSSEAACYANTVGGEGAKLLAEVKQILETNIQILDLLEEAARNWDLEQIYALVGNHDKQDDREFAMELKRVNKIVNHLSEKIINASLSATVLGLPKIKKRQMTHLSLKNLIGAH